MKPLFLLVMFMTVFLIPLEAVKEEKSSLYSLIEPPMTLSEELPITLSQENRYNFITNPALLDEEAKRNAAFMKRKSIPWLPLLSAFVVTLAILIIRLWPSKSTEEQIDPQLKEKTTLKIEEELKKLFSNVPKDENESKSMILQTDFLLKLYLENQYEFPAFSYTVQELNDKIETLQDLSSSTIEGMKKTFEIADKIKFAKYVPSPNDFQALDRFNTKTQRL